MKENWLGIAFLLFCMGSFVMGLSAACHGDLFGAVIFFTGTAAFGWLLYKIT